MAKRGKQKKDLKAGAGKNVEPDATQSDSDGHVPVLLVNPDNDRAAPADADSDLRFPVLARHVVMVRNGSPQALVDASSLPVFPVTEPGGPLRSRRIKRLGWNRDLPDARDHLYAAPHFVSMPASMSLRAQCPEVYDQGEIGSCTANAIAAAIQYERMRQGLTRASATPSRLFIYYNERVIEGDVIADKGAQIRDGIKVISSQGDCFEGKGKSDWPYDIARVNDKPTPACYTSALRDRAVSYSRLIQQLDQLKGCLASGFPFVFGFACYDAFESQEVAKTGVLNMPGRAEKLVGGHAVMAVGYDDATHTFQVRNSWGKDWGQQGYFDMPYEYLISTELCADFWTIRLVSGTKAN
ncbi:C1 family peptidase [Caballeronia sp. GACF4]|uniref:C1 family peptidase n=1 Tax=Caballeronia sp. GACF4 TaxID=2921763 RepID=UPI00202945A4|nr:C1 family peptidase [Caballeronia sp. GACF4]